MLPPSFYLLPVPIEGKLRPLASQVAPDSPGDILNLAESDHIE